jgi:hypothetical protein
LQDVQFPLGVLKYFCAVQRLNIARANPYDAQARAASPLSPLSLAAPGPQTTTEQGTRTMRMMSERAIALLLALVTSGTAFNTFIV